VLLSRLAVLAIALIAAAMAWDKGGTILGLVAFAWAGFGAAFGPTVILSLYWRRLTTLGAAAGMVAGAAAVAVWGRLSGGIFDVYEILPGFVLNALVAWLVSLATRAPDPTDWKSQSEI
jgi:sodium/proline symporter